MLAALALTAFLALQQTAQQSPEPLPFRVIVHSANPVTSLSREQLSSIFLKRIRRWPDRTEAIPLDQPATSQIRERFSRAIHLKSIAYVTRYWHRLIFSGRGVPPLELSSSAAVIEFVKANRGAIGYIDRAAPIDQQVREITISP